MRRVSPGQRVAPHAAQGETVHAGFIRAREYSACLPELPHGLRLSEEGCACCLLRFHNHEQHGERVAEMLSDGRSLFPVERVAGKDRLHGIMFNLPRAEPSLKLRPWAAEVQQQQERHDAT